MDEHHAQEALAIFRLTIPELSVLAAHHLPCFRHGGILVTDTRIMPLAAPVFLLLTLPGESEPVAANGRIASRFRHESGQGRQHEKGDRKPLYTYGIQFLQDSSSTDTAICKLLGKKAQTMPGLGHTVFNA